MDKQKFVETMDEATFQELGEMVMHKFLESNRQLDKYSLIYSGYLLGIKQETNVTQEQAKNCVDKFKAEVERQQEIFNMFKECGFQ